MIELLTVADYAALGESLHGYTELQEGRVVASPSPRPAHNMASGSIYMQLVPQLPDEFVIIQDVDIDLELTPPAQPGFSRRPDLIVVHRAASSGLSRAAASSARPRSCSPWRSCPPPRTAWTPS